MSSDKLYQMDDALVSLVREELHRDNTQTSSVIYKKAKEVLPDLEFNVLDVSNLLYHLPAPKEDSMKMKVWLIKNLETGELDLETNYINLHESEPDTSDPRYGLIDGYKWVECELLLREVVNEVAVFKGVE